MPTAKATLIQKISRIISGTSTSPKFTRAPNLVSSRDRLNQKLDDFKDPNDAAAIAQLKLIPTADNSKKLVTAETEKAYLEEEKKQKEAFEKALMQLTANNAAQQKKELEMLFEAYLQDCRRSLDSRSVATRVLFDSREIATKPKILQARKELIDKNTITFAKTTHGDEERDELTFTDSSDATIDAIFKYIATGKSPQVYSESSTILKKFLLLSIQNNIHISFSYKNLGTKQQKEIQDLEKILATQVATKALPATAKKYLYTTWTKLKELQPGLEKTYLTLLNSEQLSQLVLQADKPEDRENFLDYSAQQLTEKDNSQFIFSFLDSLRYPEDKKAEEEKDKKRLLTKIDNILKNATSPTPTADSKEQSQIDKLIEEINKSPKSSTALIKKLAKILAQFESKEYQQQIWLKIVAEEDKEKLQRLIRETEEQSQKRHQHFYRNLLNFDKEDSAPTIVKRITTQINNCKNDDKELKAMLFDWLVKAALLQKTNGSLLVQSLQDLQKAEDKKTLAEKIAQPVFLGLHHTDADVTAITEEINTSGDDALKTTLIDWLAKAILSQKNSGAALIATFQKLQNSPDKKLLADKALTYNLLYTDQDIETLTALVNTAAPSLKKTLLDWLFKAGSAKANSANVLATSVGNLHNGLDKKVLVEKMIAKYQENNKNILAKPLPSSLKKAQQTANLTRLITFLETAGVANTKEIQEALLPAAPQKPEEDIPLLEDPKQKEPSPEDKLRTAIANITFQPPKAQTPFPRPS